MYSRFDRGMLRAQHSVTFVGFGGNFVIYLKNEKEGGEVVWTCWGG